MPDQKPTLDYRKPEPKRLGIWVAFVLAAMFIAMFFALEWYLNAHGG